MKEFVAACVQIAITPNDVGANVKKGVHWLKKAVKEYEADIPIIAAANKLKNIVHLQSLSHEMIVEGMVAIAEGENPRNIETKLLGFLR